MGPGSGKRPPVPDAARRRDLLVLGYQGTLIADPKHSATAPADVGGALCVHKFSLEPWLTDALRGLDLRISAEQRTFGGEPIDLGGLVEALRERLRDILTQVLAVSPDLTEESIARKFPALAALMKSAVAEWVEAVAVFHERLHADASRLAAWMGYSQLPSLTSLTAASSDSHGGGHRALRLIFQGGRCIYYKPRPVTGEWLWDRLIHAVNAHSSLRLASAGVLSGANRRYGWVASLLPHAELHRWDRSSPQDDEYWHAAGATLCLAGHLRMTDLHMANVLATCRGPAPFDAETLGTPRAASPSRERSGSETTFATVIDDLLDTGLLPVRDPGELPDTSGFFGKAAPVPEILVPRWSDSSDGNLRLELAPSVLVDHGNAPPGATALEVLPLIVSGYKEAATALMRCRESLTSDGSDWRSTLERLHAPRIVLRDTLSYGILLSRSLQPERLQSPRSRRTALRCELQGHGRRDFPEAILRTEVRTLLELHVPRFTALPGSRTLAGSSGRALVPRFLACSPAEAVLRKIGELSPQRLSEIHVPGLLQAVLGQRG